MSLLYYGNRTPDGDLERAGAKPDGGITKKVGNWLGDLRGTNQAWERESQFAEKMAIDAFNREAEYNSPTAQMQRLIDAGLNPNLMYGQGTTGNTSASTPSTPKAQPSGITDLIPMLMSVGSFLKDMKVKDAQINNLNVGASQKEASTLMTTEQLSQLKERFPLLFTKLTNEIGLQGTQQEAIKAQTSKTHQEINALINRNSLFPLEKRKAQLTNEQMNEVINNLIRSGSNLTLDSDIKQQVKIEKELQNQLLKAQTMFVEQGITNPQQLMQFIGTLLIKAMSIR